MPTEQDQQVVELISAIDSKLAKVHTQSLDLSFNEILDMFNSEELDINPDYQRLFRWSEGARSRFIESLLLEMPVPPIYVIEQQEGQYLLIDGLQRISSYLHLRGELEALHLDPPVRRGDKLSLVDCDIIDELNGKTFDNLGTALQIRLKRAFVRVEVVRKGSDPRFKYHMFKRLNTGGQKLTDQQIRNCTIRLLDATFNEFVIRLSKTASFRTATEALTTEDELGAFDQELVLRFFAFKNYRKLFKHDIGDFLTEYMERVSDPDGSLKFDYKTEEGVFEKTFAVLSATLGNMAFAYANKSNTALTSGFSVLHYEAITLGMQPRIDELDPSNAVQMRELKTALTEVKLHPDFIKLTKGGGKNSPGQLNARITFVQQAVESIV